MSYKISAFAPLDGSAFLEKEGVHFFIRPPYEILTKVFLEEEEIEKAISVYGFIPFDAKFEDYNEVVSYLKDKYVAANKLIGNDIPSSDELNELLSFATPDILKQYLLFADKMVNENDNLRTAEKMVIQILKYSNIKSNNDLYDYAMKILDIIKRREEEAVSNLDNFKRINTEKAWRKKFNQLPESLLSPTIKLADRVRVHGMLQIGA